jgi:uncharacterized coiled-coil protein SlyX
MSDEKITKLEEVLMHQEQQINDLHKMVTKQWDEIDLLKKHVKRLQGALTEVTDSQNNLSAAEQAARDKPPHY